jgi:hypothetical protein
MEKLGFWFVCWLVGWFGSLFVCLFVCCLVGWLFGSLLCEEASKLKQDPEHAARTIRDMTYCQN